MIRIGTIGTSVITDDFIHSLKQVDAYQLVCVYSRDEDKARMFAEKHACPGYTSNWDALLKNPEIDAIYVASPNDLHFEQSVAILRAGKHAITEKPFVSNAYEFKQLMEVVKETGKFCFDAILPLHHPNLDVIKEALPTIGRLKLVVLNMVQYSSRYRMVLNGQIPNIFDPQHSGGALMDLGVYSTSLCIALFGKPESLTYACNKLPNGIDTSGSMILKYPDFVVSSTFGKDSFGTNDTTFCGEEASLHIPLQPSRLLRVERVTVQSREDLGVQNLKDGMVYELLDFAEIIENNDWQKYQSFMDITRDVMDCLDEARRQNGIVFRTDR
jgi:predicted dehydrogenase